MKYNTLIEVTLVHSYKYILISYKRIYVFLFYAVISYSCITYFTFYHVKIIHSFPHSLYIYYKLCGFSNCKPNTINFMYE